MILTVLGCAGGSNATKENFIVESVPKVAGVGQFKHLTVATDCFHIQSRKVNILHSNSIERRNT